MDPIINSFITHLDAVLGTNDPIPGNLRSKTWERSFAWCEHNKPDKKTEYVQHLYFTTLYLYNKLRELNIPLRDLFNQKTHRNYMILKQYLIPLLDFVTKIHPDSQEFNTFSNNYLVNDDVSEYDNIYIIENISEPTIQVISYPAKDIENYLKTNDFIINQAGTLFYKHEVRPGLFIDWLEYMAATRKAYQRLAAKAKDTGDDVAFQLNNMRQLSTKIVMNTTLIP